MQRTVRSGFLILCSLLVMTWPAHAAGCSTVSECLNQLSNPAAQSAEIREVMRNTARFGHSVHSDVMDASLNSQRREMESWKTYQNAAPGNREAAEHSWLLARVRVTSVLLGLVAVARPDEVAWLTAFPFSVRPVHLLPRNEPLAQALRLRIAELEHALGRSLMEEGPEVKPEPGQMVAFDTRFTACHDLPAFRQVVHAMETMKYEDAASQVYDRLVAIGRCLPVPEGTRARLLQRDGTDEHAAWRLEVLGGDLEGQKLWTSASGLRPLKSAWEGQ